MKNILLIALSLTVFNAINAQSGESQKNYKTPKNCFEEYYNSFSTRGAIPVKDGEHQIVISIRKDGNCECIEGKVNVIGGKIKGPVMVKKEDGSYEPTKKKLNPNTGKGENDLGAVNFIHKGMSPTISTSEMDVVNLFFVDCLKPEVKKNVAAPSPNDLKGNDGTKAAETIKPIEDTEIINKAVAALAFENGKAIIKSQSYPSLNSLADLLKRKPNYKLTITGYTDNVGNAVKNVDLSKKRADAARDYIVGHGIDASRITTNGMGSENPIAPNATAEGRAKNRRVEFLLVE